MERNIVALSLRLRVVTGTVDAEVVKESVAVGVLW